MSWLEVLVIASVVLASIPAVNIGWNLALYRRTPRATEGFRPAVSVLIPARNEEESIGAAVASVLASRGVDVELIVMDDHSTDATAQVVASFAARDSRVRLEKAPALPAGWCGKQHACARLAERAKHEILVFLDADVVLQPNALRRMAAFLERCECDLASGVPYQETVSLGERLVVPMIPFILLGYLPLAGMRRWRWAAFAAGCGQLFITRRSSYQLSGGHTAIKASRHDGLRLPRAYRSCGLSTDLFDATDLASCRMYRGSAAVWNGFAKNADEGMATPVAIGPWTLLLGGGQVAPVCFAMLSALNPTAMSGVLAAIGLGLVYLPRIALGLRLRQPISSVLLHPLGVVVVLAIQWFAMSRRFVGRPLAWKGRT